MGFDINRLSGIDTSKVDRFNFLESKALSTKYAADEIMGGLQDGIKDAIHSPTRAVTCDINLDHISNAVQGVNLESIICFDLMDSLRNSLLDPGDIDLFAGLDKLSLLLGKTDFFNLLFELKGLSLDYNLCGSDETVDLINGVNLNLPFEPSDLSINMNKLTNIDAPNGALSLNKRYSGYRNCLKDIGKKVPIDPYYVRSAPTSDLSFL